MSGTQMVLIVIMTTTLTLGMVGKVKLLEESTELTQCQQQISTLQNNIQALVYGAPGHPIAGE